MQLPAPTATNKKRAKSLLGIVLGMAGAGAVDAWPSHAAPIQIALYTVLVFLPLAFATWGDRRHRRFWTWAAVAVILHCGILYVIRSIFPFGSILTIIPLVLIEFVILFVLMLKLTGQDEVEPG